MRDNISPEEKLLRLIKGEPQEAVSPAAINASLGHKLGAKDLFYACINGPFYFFSREKNIDRALGIMFFISCLYLIISLAYPLVGLKKISLPKAAANRALELWLAEEQQETRPYEFYQNSIKSREIFSGLLSQASLPAIVDTDLVKDVNLVGVITGENPQAIIEDRLTQKTYYLSKGQFIGQLQLEDIREGKIILNYQGKRFELYL